MHSIRIPTYKRRQDLHIDSTNERHLSNSIINPKQKMTQASGDRFQVDLRGHIESGRVSWTVRNRTIVLFLGQ